MPTTGTADADPYVLGVTPELGNLPKGSVPVVMLLAFDVSMVAEATNVG